MTRDEVIRMAREAGIGDITLSVWTDTLARFAALVAAAEREACLQILNDNWFKTQSDCAAAIHARGEK